MLFLLSIRGKRAGGMEMTALCDPGLRKHPGAHPVSPSSIASLCVRPKIVWTERDWA